MSKTSTTTPLPHDWTFRNWPADVYPYEGTRGRHLVRQNQNDLVAAGALTRIGKQIVVLGAGYTKWLAAQTYRVTEFDVPANRAEHAHKRFGRGHVATAT